MSGECPRKPHLEERPVLVPIAQYQYHILYQPRMTMNPSKATSDASIEDLREYIDAFRTSSNRARYAIYIVIIATVLVWIVNRNARQDSWPLRRIRSYYGQELFKQP